MGSSAGREALAEQVVKAKLFQKPRTSKKADSSPGRPKRFVFFIFWMVIQALSSSDRL